MKKLLPILLSLLLFQTDIFAESPVLAWQRCYGGSLYEEAWSGIQTADGGYVIAGAAVSNNGNVSGNHGQTDFWVVKLDDTGGIEWQHAYGGTSADVAHSICQTYDGGYVVAGFTESNNGDVSGNHGGRDVWVVGLSSTGELLWQRCYGGTWMDEGDDIKQTTDSGFIVTGFAASADGDVSAHYGPAMSSRDCWTIKLNRNGNIQWERSAGGTVDDGGLTVRQVTDGGYIVAGKTNSCDNDAAGCHGGMVTDGLLVKYSSAGVKQWAKVYGGTGNDGIDDIAQTAQGGYIFVGYTFSLDGDVSHLPHGGGDGWIVKLDDIGNIQWDKCLGGSQWDETISIVPTAGGGYVISGVSMSTDFGVTGFHGGTVGDAWLLKVNDTGHILWEKCFGGTDTEWGRCVVQTTDGGYLMAGSTESVDGDVSGIHGDRDFWVVKFFPWTSDVKNVSASQAGMLISPNPSNGQFEVKLPNSAGRASLSVVNILGQEVARKDFVGDKTDMSLPGIAGVYFVRLTIGATVYTSKLLID